MYITFCGVLVTFDPFTVCYLSCLQTSFRVSRKQLVSMPSLQEMTSWYLITPSLLTSKINERKMQEDCCMTRVVTNGLLSGLVSCKAILLRVAFLVLSGTNRIVLYCMCVLHLLKDWKQRSLLSNILSIFFFRSFFFFFAFYYIISAPIF